MIHALELAIDARGTALRGRWRLELACAGPPRDLTLDYRGDTPAAALLVNGTGSVAVRGPTTIVIPSRALRAGDNALEMPVACAIAPGSAPVLRHDDPDDGAAYVYTLFVPADASALFPCVDRPDTKARFRLALTVPPGWIAVSCMPGERAAADRWAFAATPPLPTYAFGFAAGPFVAIDGEAAGVPGRAFVRRAAADRLRDDAREALRLAHAAAQWGEGFFGWPFPFAKHDLVVVPAFPFSGMEHAGATFLDEGAIAIGAQPAPGARSRRAQLVFHETVHQWLGDCVTMASFTDLWLKEGFANLGAALCAQACAPDLQPWLAMHRLKTAALRQDLSAAAAPVRRPVAQPGDAKALYGPGVYGKAPALLAQARRLLGPEAFDAGVRAFVHRHAFGAATCDDLADALQEASGRPMRDWLQRWLDAPGAPTLRLELDTHAGRVAAARVRVTGRAPVQRLEAVAIAPTGAVQRTHYATDAAEIALTAWIGAPAPLIAFPDAGNHGYARVLLDDATREAALAQPHRVAEPLLRLQLAEALWEHVRDASLDPARYLAFALRRIEAEDEWAIRATLLEHAETAARRYVDDGERDAARPALERARFALGPATSAPADPRCAALLARAALPDPAEKARCFDALLHDPDLPERWIALAAEHFNAPEQAALTLPFLVPALAALPSLAANRRIFFVDRWLAAFVGGQTSAAALAAVQGFLAGAALPAELVRKVHAHADELARTVRIRARYARLP